MAAPILPQSRQTVPCGCGGKIVAVNWETDTPEQIIPRMESHINLSQQKLWMV